MKPVLAPVETLAPLPPRGGGQRKLRRWERWFLAALCLLLVLFPKGGLKLAGIPVTWGYIALGAATGLACLLCLLDRKMSWVRGFGWVILFALPMQLTFYAALAFLGYDSLATMGSVAVAVTILPLMFFGMAGRFFDCSPALPLVLEWVKFAVLAAAVFGLLHFGVRTATGRSLAIPYLTTNGSEDEEALAGKNNTRGDLRKLVSTYNNGNIYGICTLMLLPLFTVLEKSFWRQLLVKGALVLTLSRTVWVGLLMFEVLSALFLRRVSLARIAAALAALVFAGAGIALALSSMDRSVTWMADSELGGRGGQFEILDNMELLPTAPFNEIVEIVWLSFLRELGFVGLLALIALLAIPFVGFVRNREQGSIRRACVMGCFIYTVISVSDGAFMLIPTMSFFWFLAVVAWCQNPFLGRYNL